MNKGMKRPDWERIEADYRAGIKSLRQMAEENNVSHNAIAKRAKRDEWPRDLAAKIRAKAKQKVDRASVDKPVDSVTDRDIVEVESEIQSRITLTHRKDIPHKRELVSKLFAEIEGMTDGKELFETLQEALLSNDQFLMAKAVNKVISLPQRIKGTTELVNAFKSLIGLERQAFGIDDNTGETMLPPAYIERVVVDPEKD